MSQSISPNAIPSTRSEASSFLASWLAQAGMPAPVGASPDALAAAALAPAAARALLRLAQERESAAHNAAEAQAFSLALSKSGMRGDAAAEHAMSAGYAIDALQAAFERHMAEHPGDDPRQARQALADALRSSFGSAPSSPRGAAALLSSSATLAPGRRPSKAQSEKSEQPNPLPLAGAASMNYCGAVLRAAKAYPEHASTSDDPPDDLGSSVSKALAEAANRLREARQEELADQMEAGSPAAQAGVSGDSSGLLALAATPAPLLGAVIGDKLRRGRAAKEQATATAPAAPRMWDIPTIPARPDRA